MLYHVSSELIFSSEPVTLAELEALAGECLHVDDVRFTVEQSTDTVRLYAEKLTDDARLPFIDWKPSSRPHTYWTQVARAIVPVFDDFTRAYALLVDDERAAFDVNVTLDEALAAARDAYEAFKVKPLVFDEPPAARDERIKAYRDMLGALAVLHWASMRAGTETTDLNRALFGLLEAHKANLYRARALDHATSRYLTAAFILFDEVNEGA